MFDLLIRKFIVDLILYPLTECHLFHLLALQHLLLLLGNCGITATPFLLGIFGVYLINLFALHLVERVDRLTLL